jgi:hypothetical protein
MMKRSPKGLFAFKRRDGSESAAQSIDGFIAEVEAWANRILDEAGIKVDHRSGFIKAPASFTNKQIEALLRRARARGAAGGRRTASEVADDRQYADVVHFALKAIAKANQLRHALDIAAARGTGAQALFWLSRMMEFCGTAFAGKIVESETPLFAGMRASEGGRKGGAASRKVTPEKCEKIRRFMATVPHGQRTNAYRKLARDLGLGPRTVERVASEK